ncbi:MAG: hypothetical protein KDD53_12050, partial [Bdellovibrionales bacterium]|nr:hypothetical protein [Bdellovibrionales bacterium]
MAGERSTAPNQVTSHEDLSQIFRENQLFDELLGNHQIDSSEAALEGALRSVFSVERIIAQNPVIRRALAFLCIDEGPN